MEYRIVTHYNAFSLAQRINEFIAGGWAPQGGVSVAISPGGGELYAQAMVREVK